MPMTKYSRVPREKSIVLEKSRKNQATQIAPPFGSLWFSHNPRIVCIIEHVIVRGMVVWV